MIIEGDFARDGVVCVRKAFGEDDLALAEAAVEANLAELSPLAIRASPEDDGRFVEDFCNWQRIAPLEQFIRRASGAAIAGRLTGSRTIRLYHDHLLVKEAGTRQRTPWHQDQPYYNVNGHQLVSMWLPLDPVDRSSSLEVVAASHTGQWYLPRTFLDHHAAWFPQGSLAELPDIDGDRQRWRVLSWDLEPGDAVFFHMLAIHGAGPAPLAHDRRVLSLRFIGDDVTFAPRPWRTSPPFPGLEDELLPGAALDHPLFPVVWRNDDTAAALPDSGSA